MESRAFISHTKGSIDAGRIIVDQLEFALQMESFLSVDHITPGDRIMEKILQNLVETDIFFQILEPLAEKSQWLRWEYRFCKEHDIKIVPVAHKMVIPAISDFEWVNRSIKRIEFELYDDLRLLVWDMIKKSDAELEQRASARNKAKIDAEPDRTECTLDGEVTISGTAQEPVGAAYVHHPVDGNGAPHSRYVRGLNTDTDGRFWFKFRPGQVVGSRTDKIFVEIRFGPKSKLIQIDIKGGPAETRTAPSRPPASGSVGRDSADARQRMDEISRGTVRGISTTIRNRTIPLDDRVSDVEEALAKRGRVAVTGEKGSGKSVLLCKAYERLSKDRPAFFVRCDDHLGAESFEDLDKDIMPGFNFADALCEVARRAKPVVIFDSVDAISRSKKPMNALKHLLQKLWANDRISTVVSVRSYDYEYSSIINRTDWGEEYRLKPITDSELGQMLEHLGSPDVPDRLKDMFYNPFRLKLLSLILEKAPDADFGDMRHETDLYYKHWHEYVEKTESPAKAKDLLYGVSREMAKRQQMAIPYDDFGDQGLMDGVCGEGVLVRNKDSLVFFHHAYLDYVISKFIIERQDLVDFVSNDRYNTFLRPTVVFALSWLHRDKPALFAGTIERILKSDLKYFWKISALTAMSQITELGGQDFPAIAELLTRKKVLRGHFLIESAKRANPVWFELWKDTYFEKWILDPALKPDLITSYLSSIKHEARHGDIFRAVRKIVERAGNVFDQRNAVKLAAELEADGQAEWMSKMAANEHVHVRAGLAESLPKLMDACPRAVPGIFCDLFTYEEKSTEKTTAASYGEFRLTSNLQQDNMMVVWQLGQTFPELLKKNPELMVRGAVRLFEKLLHPLHQNQKGDIIEDRMTYSSDGSGAKRKIVKDVGECVSKCTEEELRRLAPIIRKTRLATFRALLLDAMVARKERFLQEIFAELSDPQAYLVGGMGGSVLAAIGGVAAMLEKEQASSLLDTIMDARQPGKSGSGAAALMRKAAFLSAFPQDLLGPVHRDVLDRHSPKLGTPSSGPKVQVRKDAEPDPKKILERHCGGDKGLDRKDVLMALLKCLEGGVELDEREVSGMRRLLSDCKGDPDPAESEDEQDGSLAYSFTVRGLVAECAIIMTDMYKDASLVPLVRELSKDPSNVVRADVCKSLPRLANYDYSLAYEIGLEYSRDGDRRVQFFVQDMLRIAAGKDAGHALRMLENMVGAGNKSEHVSAYILYLALAKSEPRAASLLDAAIDGADGEICMHLPFYLKPYMAEFQDEALDVFYRLLADPDHQVREKACFFLLGWAEDSADGGLLPKIERHLDRIASEIGRSPCDPRLLEELAKFLAKKWEQMPGKSLEYLEKIAGMGEYAQVQPVLAEETLKVLSGLLHQPLPEKEAQRCLDVLDTYAMAGWPDALGLLSAMEKRD